MGGQPNTCWGLLDQSGRSMPIAQLTVMLGGTAESSSGLPPDMTSTEMGMDTRLGNHEQRHSRGQEGEGIVGLLNLWKEQVPGGWMTGQDTCTG